MVCASTWVWLVALAVSGCSVATSTGAGDCGCAHGSDGVPGEADTAADAIAASSDVTAGSPNRPTCDSRFVDLSADPTTLVPPPLEVTIAAHGGGGDVTSACAWQVGPASVCAPGSSPGHVRKVGDGTCTAVCTLPSGSCGAVDLLAAEQTVIYVVGGERIEASPVPGAAADAGRISRLRVHDARWDATVAWLPEFRIQPALAVRDRALYVLGGETGGDYSGAQFWDVFFPTCPEAIITPTQLKAEVGCRTVRRLDLATGLWDSPFQWPHPRVDLGWRQVGDQVYLLGGQRAKTITQPQHPEFLWLADLGQGKVTAPLLQVPQPIQEADAALEWPAMAVTQLGGVPLLFHARKTWFASVQGGLVEKDLGWPCTEKSPHAVFRFPGQADVLFVLGNGNPQGSLAQGAQECPKCPYDQKMPDGSTTPWCTPLRYRDKAWALGKPMPYAQVVEGPDALYALAPDATYVLHDPDGAWLPELPPMPYARFGAAAVAVRQ